MSSLDQILGRPIIPIHYRQQQTTEERHPIIKRLNHLYKRRMKLWDRKALEYEQFDLGTKELFWKHIGQIKDNPVLWYGWQMQKRHPKVKKKQKIYNTLII